MSEQVGIQGLIGNLRQEAPYWSTLLPQLPRLLHSYLSTNEAVEQRDRLWDITKKYRRANAMLIWTSLLLAGVTGALLVLLLR